MDHAVKQAADQRRQQEEQADGKQHTEHDGERDHRLLHLFTAKLFFQPLVKFGGLGVFLLGEKLRRVHERLHARDHRRGEIHHAADERPFCDARALFERLDLRDDALRPAHDNRPLVWPLHHNALDQRLTADERLEFFLDDRFVLFFHESLLFLPRGDTDRDERAAALCIFERQRAAVHGDDLLADGEADAAAARLGAALIEF